MSAHALLVAAIFVPYVLLMVGLGIYIWKTGQPGDTTGTTDTSEKDERDDRDPGGLLAAA